MSYVVSKSVEMVSEFPKGKFNPVNLLADFFNQLHIIERFSVFESEYITGWENWFQIELAYFLHHHVTELDGEWWREFNINWDGMPQYMGKCKPDFWLWAGEENSYYLLELKQHDKLHIALKEIAKDIQKLSTLTNTKTFNAIGYEGEYICKGKLFVLVSKCNSKIDKIPAGVIEACSGAIGNSGYYFVVYNSI